MRILLSCIVTLYLLFHPMANAQELLKDTVVFGSDSNFPPYEFLDPKGNPAGFNVDLIQAIGKEMGFHVKIKLGVWHEIRSEFENQGTIDILDMYYLKSREDQVDYANAHEVNYDEIYVQKGRKDIQSIEDLNGRLIAVQESSTIEEYIRLQYPEIKLLPVTSEPEALKQLSQGNCEAAIVSRIIAYDAISKLNIKNIVNVGIPFMPRPLSFVVKDGNKQLLDLINLGLFRLKENGKFSELRKKWIEQDQNKSLSKKLLIAGSLFAAFILLAGLWIATLKYTVALKTKELEFTNSRLHLISNVKAARIDKLSTKEQSVELLKQVQETFNADACVMRILVKNEMKLLGSVGVPQGLLSESISDGQEVSGINPESNGTGLQTELWRKDLTAYWFTNELAEHNYPVFASTPLISEGQTTGVISIYSQNKDRIFTKKDVEHLQIVANQIGISIENNRLFDQNEKQKEILVRQIIANKKAKDEIQKLNEELEQRVNERTAELQAVNKELETFTYSVSHDLKAPLRGIDGFSKLLVDIYQKDLNDEARHFLQIIRNSTKQMSQLIDELLEYSRMERSLIKSEPVQLSKLIDSIVSRYTGTLESGRFLLINHIPEVVLQVDVKGLTIALRNLIENAIKFTNGKPEPTIEISMSETDSVWVISVKDNGIGFDMKYHDRIFNIFQRLHRVEDFPGTGIGLAMVSKSVHRMNGKVWAESEPGAGSTFFLELPKNTSS